MLTMSIYSGLCISIVSKIVELFCLYICKNLFHVGLYNVGNVILLPHRLAVSNAWLNSWQTSKITVGRYQ